MKSMIYEAIILTLIISARHSTEALKCYNCTECSEPTNPVDCPSDKLKCIIATGYLTNGTFQMMRTCTSYTNDLYEWTSAKKQTFEGVDYTDVSAITCTEDYCNNDSVSIPKKVDCYSCDYCKTPTGVDTCEFGCLTAAGLPFNEPYNVLRSCAPRDVLNFIGDEIHLFQEEIQGKVYNYVWLKKCNDNNCNNGTVNYTNPFEADSYFDFSDTEVEDSASERKWNRVLIVINFLATCLIFYL